MLKGYLFLVVTASVVSFTFMLGAKISKGSNPHNGTAEDVKAQIAYFRARFSGRGGDEIRNDSQIVLA